MKSAGCLAFLFRGLTAAASLKLCQHLRRHARRKAELFRGLTAAASLKPLISRSPSAHRRSLPRPHRRGLIEARRSSRLGSEAARLFRGLTAAASLKLWSSHPPSGAAGLFRGLTAAASLKHWTTEVEDTDHHISSAASPPRPH